MTQPAIQQTFDRALQHHRAGQLPEAEQLYQKILTQQPEHPAALLCLAMVHHQFGRRDSALDLLRRAIVLKPDYAEAYYNLGIVMIESGRPDEAIAAYQQAIALNPRLTEAHCNLGNALKEKGRFDEAIAAYQKAISLNPAHAESHSNLGNALRDKGQLDEAMTAYRQAIALRPNYADAHTNFGVALKDKGLLDQAVAAFRRAIALNPSASEPHVNLGLALKDLGQLDESVAAYRRAIALKPGCAVIHSDLILTLHYHPGQNAGSIAEELRRFNLQRAQPLRKNVWKNSTDRNPDRPLRIGYVSPDFRDHPVGRNLLPLFRHHDRQRFEITGYAQVPLPDAMTRQFEQNADDWRMISGLSDEQVAGQIQSDQIDILVDLALHTGGNRLLVFARKPAPIQVTFGGYPGGTGLDAFDYRLTDPYLDPPGQHEDWYVEKSLRLPKSFWCYDPQAMEAPTEPVNPLPALQNGFITFGCLNSFFKVNDAVLDLWAAVMRQTPTSRLALLCPAGTARQLTEEKFQHHQIAPERLEWIERSPRMNYLQTYRRIDLGLDSFPYNGHTTSLDSLWMGVPVVTLVGTTAVGRAGLSQLSNLGLTDLIATTPDQFIQIASGVANNVPRLSNLRQTLRQRMLNSPLCDADQFTRGIESAYRQMWRAWCETSKPASPS